MNIGITWYRYINYIKITYLRIYICTLELLAYFIPRMCVFNSVYR